MKNMIIYNIPIEAMVKIFFPNLSFRHEVQSRRILQKAKISTV